MGCGASTPIVTVSDELITQQHDRLTRGKFIPTIIPKEGNDYTVLMKVLDEAAAHILLEKKKSQHEVLSTICKTKSKNTGKNNSRFNQILESRRQVQEEALGRTPRSNAGLSSARMSSPRSPPMLRRGDPSATPRNPAAFTFDEPQNGSCETADLGPAHGEVALGSLPYDAKLVLLRLMRHPIGLIHYWNFIKYLDYNSAVNLSPNVEEAVRQKALANNAALLNLNLVPNFSIPHSPTLASDAPFESVFLLFLHLDKLTRMGTVPPQIKNPYGYIIHFRPNNEPMGVMSPVPAPPRPGLSGAPQLTPSADAEQPGFPSLGRRMSVPMLDVSAPVSDSDIDYTKLNAKAADLNAGPEAGKPGFRDIAAFSQPGMPTMNVKKTVSTDAHPEMMTSQSSEVLARRCVQAQRALQAQYIAQATIIRSHRVFYENLLSQAQNIMESFLSPTAATLPTKFHRSGFYSPNALCKTVQGLLPATTVELLSRSLGAFIRVLKTVLSGVALVDNQHQANLKYLESFERAGGIMDSHVAQGFIFTTTHNEYYTDLDVYDILLRSPVVPKLGRIDTLGARFLYPFLAHGAGMTSSTVKIISNTRATDGLASMSSRPAAAGAAASAQANTPNPSPLACAQASVITCAPRADGYQYQALCVPPRTTYIPEAGLRFAREQILAYLAAYTLTPFVLSGVYGMLKQNIVSCATQLITAAQKKVPETPSSAVGGFTIMRTLSPAPGTNMGMGMGAGIPGSSSSIISAAMQSMAPQTPSGIPVLTSAQLPPQMLLQDCMKCANYAAWTGYGVPGNLSIGMGPHPLVMSPGNPMIENLGLAPATIHPLNDTSSINTKNGLPRRASIVPGIVTQQTIEQVNTLTPMGAFDLTRAIISRELIKAFAYAAAIAPPQIGVCVISLLATSSNHAMWLKHKGGAVTLPAQAQMNTCKVVFTNQEFAKMCGAAETDFNSGSGSGAAVGMGTGAGSSVYTFHSGSQGSLTGLHRTASPPPVSSLSISPSPTNADAHADGSGSGSNGGYLCVLGRDYKDLLVDDGDKEYLLDQMTSLKPAHVFARLATPCGTRYTPVVLSMKPVFMRVRPNSHNMDKGLNMGIGASLATPTADAFNSTNQYDTDNTDIDSFDTNAKAYSHTYISPLFYICTAVRVQAPPKAANAAEAGKGVSPAGGLGLIEEKDAIASVYSAFPCVSPLFSQEKKAPQKTMQKTSTLAELDQPSLLASGLNGTSTSPSPPLPVVPEGEAGGSGDASLFLSKDEEDCVFDYADGERAVMLKHRWAHDMAWLGLFPDIHDVILP